MVTRDLIEYIKSEAKRGIHKESIKYQLLNKHWLAEDVKEAMSYVFPEKQTVGRTVMVAKPIHPPSVRYDKFVIKHVALKVFVREIFGLVWLIDAYYKWQPEFSDQFLSLLQDASTNQPGFLKPWYDFWINFSTSHMVLMTHLIAFFESYFALALILGFARKTTYIVGIFFSIIVWSLGEGFGGLHETDPVDLGAAVMYSLMFLALFVLNYYSGPSGFSLDALIEKNFPWWKKVAES